MGWWLAMMTAQAAAVSPPTAAATTIQQSFDAATTLDATGTPAARVTAWRTLADRVRGNRRTRAIVHAREAAALAAMGQSEEAETLASAALADLPPTDATLRSDRYDTSMLLAEIAEDRLDYAEAAARYMAAEALAQTPPERFGAELGEIRTATYTDRAAARAAIARADAVAATVKTEPVVAGMLRRYDAELRLNEGDIAGAKVEAAEAVRLMGGLTARTDANDVSVRSDYAIAALLSGHPDDAREYIAMTGAGRMPGGVFGRGVDMPVPDCGGDAALKPDDLAVVEFSVTSDGRTAGVRPVYAAGGGAAALEFARTVAGWSWTPEQLTYVPPFFRNRVRLELRCSTSFAHPPLSAYLDDQLGRWLAEKNVEMPSVPSGSDAAVLPGERRLLAAAEARHGADALALVPVLHLIVRNRVSTGEETQADAAREASILAANGAPPLARLGPDLIVATHQRDSRAAIAALAARYAADPRAAGALALFRAGNGRGRARVETLLRPVAEDSSLAPSDPIRSAALLRLASLQEQAGDPAAARTLYLKANLPPQSCALIDAPPHLLSAGGEFPSEAIRWGFEGWALLQFDISAAGRVGNERAIIAYPPFVFTKAAIATMAGARYSKTYRPDGQLGCGGETTGVKFLLPGPH